MIYLLESNHFCFFEHLQSPVRARGLMGNEAYATERPSAEGNTKLELSHSDRFRKFPFSINLSINKDHVFKNGTKTSPGELIYIP